MISLEEKNYNLLFHFLKQAYKILKIDKHYFFLSKIYLQKSILSLNKHNYHK